MAPSSSNGSIRYFPRGLFAAALLSASFAVGCTANPEPTGDGEDPGATEDAVSGTVGSAVSNSCATSSVKGLSKQIIAEAKCMSPDAYTAVPDLGNVSFGGSVFAYLEKPARDKLTAALKAKTSKSMTVNSMLRTIAQQYLLYRWYQTGRCGIGLAAKPGNSNHETGLAVDISEYSSWKGTLQAYGFHWLGSSDPVHFDYAGAGAKSYKGVDVKAFQRLWNRNHPSDKIDTDGVWGPQTEARMKKAPAGGFAKGASCSGSQSFEDDTDLEVIGADDVMEGPWAGSIEEAIADGADADDIADVDADAEVHATLGAPKGAEEASDEACSTCFSAICAEDSYCCDTAWDDRCVTTGLALCAALCGEDATQAL